MLLLYARGPQAAQTNFVKKNLQKRALRLIHFALYRFHASHYLTYILPLNFQSLQVSLMYYYAWNLLQLFAGKQYF